MTATGDLITLLAGLSVGAALRKRRNKYAPPPPTRALRPEISQSPPELPNAAKALPVDDSITTAAAVPLDSILQRLEVLELLMKSTGAEAAEMSASLQENSTQLRGLTGRVAALEAASNEAEETRRRMEARLGAAEERAGRGEGAAGALSAAVEALREKVVRLEASYEALAAQLRERAEQASTLSNAPAGAQWMVSEANALPRLWRIEL